jgi:CRP-like cAMP-binding protein
MGCNESKGLEEVKDEKSVEEPTQEKRIEIQLCKKRENVFTETVDMSKAPVATKAFPKTAAQRDLINTALDQNFVFANLTEDERSLLINAMERQEIKANFNVIKQGDDGDFFYIIEKGSFTVAVDDVQVSSLSDGKSFGELALIYNTPRQATVKSAGASVVFALDRHTFRYILAKSSADRSQEIQTALSKVSILSSLQPDQIAKVSEVVEIIVFDKGQTIIKKGSEGNIFYMVKTGSVRVNDGGAGIFNEHTLGAGHYFGERALMTGEPRAANVIADTKCLIMALDRESFNSVLGPLREVVDHNLNMRVLENIPLFENLTAREKSKVSRSFEFETFTEGQVIIREGDKGRKFYIIKDGTAKVMKGNSQVATLEAGQYFGEMALLDDEERKASIVAVQTVECFVLDRPTFNRIMGSLKDILARDRAERDKTLNELETGSNTLKIKFEDLNAIAVLGAGTFGRVSLVQEKGKKDHVYALKALIKSEIVLHKQEANVIQEKNVMLHSNHPFILRLYATFKDQARLYMLLEFVQGGELFTVVHTATSDGVPASQAKFYGAGVLLGLCYLHSKDIAYRDMKPENCLIDADGYPKVVDFGFAKVIKNTKTFTLCGTPEYLAPEIVLGRGHDKAVDYWAFGILVYEMIAGYSPFSDPENMDQVVICRNIVNGRLMFPRNFDPDCKEMIKLLLNRDPSSRLGNLRGGYDEVKSCRWFSNFDFDAMMKKTLKAPWKPAVKSITDTSNFDPMEDEDREVGPIADHSSWDQYF